MPWVEHLMVIPIERKFVDGNYCGELHNRQEVFCAIVIVSSLGTIMLQNCEIMLRMVI